MPAGCLHWFKNVLAAHGDYFAYCATTTVYIFNLKTFKCEKLISVSERSLTCLAWNTKNPSMIATGDLDNFICVWDV